MKLIFTRVLFFILFVGFVSFLHAQEKNLSQEKVTEYIENDRVFELEEFYPTVKDNLPPAQQLITEAMLAKWANNPQLSVEKAMEVLEMYQSSIQGQDIGDMMLLMVDGFFALQMYQDALGVLLYFLEVTDNLSMLEDIDRLPGRFKKVLKYKDMPASQLIRPESDVEIPFTYRRVGRGENMFVKGSINGQSVEYMFDTGASLCTLSDEMAKRIGVHYTTDTLSIGGINGNIPAVLGVIDSLRIGDISFFNAKCAVRMLPSVIDTIYEAIVGMDFINAVGKIQILGKQQKMIFPFEETPLPEFGKNMMMQDYQSPFIKVYSDNEPLLFYLDTGDVGIALQNNYYQKHVAKVEEVAQKNIIKAGGLGGIMETEVYVLPDFPLQIGEEKVNIKDINIFTSEDWEGYSKVDGVLGTAFVKMFDKVILNFRNCFIIVE